MQHFYFHYVVRVLFYTEGVVRNFSIPAESRLKKIKIKLVYLLPKQIKFRKIDKIEANGKDCGRIWKVNLT